MDGWMDVVMRHERAHTDTDACESRSEDPTHNIHTQSICSSSQPKAQIQLMPTPFGSVNILPSSLTHMTTIFSHHIEGTRNSYRRELRHTQHMAHHTTLDWCPHLLMQQQQQLPLYPELINTVHMIHWWQNKASHLHFPRQHSLLSSLEHLNWGCCLCQNTVSTKFTRSSAISPRQTWGRVGRPTCWVRWHSPACWGSWGWRTRRCSWALRGAVSAHAAAAALASG